MSEIKVYISYNERTNTRGYWNFTIEDAVPEVGDTFHGEEVKSVDEIKPDIQNNDEVFNYDYYVVKATQDGEYNEDDDIGMMYYIAVERIETMNEEKVLILEAEDIEDELIRHIDEVLKENDPDYIGLRYADGNYINYVFKA